MEFNGLSSILSCYVRSLNVRGDFIDSDIYILWHRYLIGGMAIFKDKKFYGLVSSHRDGLIAASVMERLNIRPLFVDEYGNADGKTVMKIIKSNVPVIIVGDGPKGPPFVMRKSIEYIAKRKKTVFVDIDMNGISLNTWDKLILPFPFYTLRYKMNYGSL